MIFVELCAGLSGVSLHLLGLTPPASRIGAKGGYAAAILAAMSVTDPETLLLVDADPALHAAMTALVERPIELADAVKRRMAGSAETVWRTARSERASDPAAWWLWTAGARGGIGGFKGKHKLRPSVDGFIPSRDSLVQRIRAYDGRTARVRTLHADMRSLDPIPGATVYIDPPYAGTQGYGLELPLADVLAVADRWVEAGCPVGISWHEPLDLPGWTTIDLSEQRKGQSRRSLTRTSNEFLFLKRPWL